MASYNRVILAGNLTRDPELRHIPSGQPVVHFTVAVNSSFATQSGEKKEEVSFIPVIVWGKQAENCNKYLSKGRPVLVEGRLKQETWDDKTSGEKKSVLKVVANNVQFLGGRDASGGHDEYPEMNKCNEGAPSYEDDKYGDVPF